MIPWVTTGAFIALISYCIASKYRSLRGLSDKSKSLQIKIPSYVRSSPQLSHILEQPFLDLLSRGGKGIRVLLTYSIARVCCKDEQQYSEKQRVVEGIAILIECLHNASLIVDDIEDNSKVRRDQPAAHIKYGVKHSIVSANYVYFKAFNELIKAVPAQYQFQLHQIFTTQMLLCHLGQADDLFAPLQMRTNQFQIDQFRQQDYIRMVVSKTGSLLRMMVRMVTLIFDVQPAIRSILIGIVQYTGIAFQIYDDFKEVKEEVRKGGVHEDIVERKLTLMVIKTLQTQNRNRFLPLFLKPEKSEQDIREIIKLMEEDGSVDYSLQRHNYYAGEVSKLVSSLPQSPSRDHLEVILKKIIFR